MGNYEVLYTDNFATLIGQYNFLYTNNSVDIIETSDSIDTTNSVYIYKEKRFLGDNLENVFGFSGHNGYGPGKHISKENISTDTISNMMKNLNIISSYITKDNFYLYFYGCIELTYDSVDLYGILCDNFSNGGIDLKYINKIYDSSLNCLKIPLKKDLVLDKKFIGCRVLLQNIETNLLPVFYKTSFSYDKYIYIRFLDILNNKYAESSFYELLNGGKLFIFGGASLSKEEI